MTSYFGEAGFLVAAVIRNNHRVKSQRVKEMRVTVSKSISKRAKLSRAQQTDVCPASKQPSIYLRMKTYYILSIYVHSVFQMVITLLRRKCL